MNVLIPTIGSRGDVQPFIALAQGLQLAGHSTTLASHPTMKNLIESHGVTFAPMGPNIDLAHEVAAIRQHARHPAIGLIQGMRFGFNLLERSHEDLMVLCRQVDLVVVPTAVAAGKNEAELLNRPYLSVSLMPWAIQWDDPDRPVVKRLVYSGIDGLVHLITTLPLNRIRKRQGLPPVGKEGLTSTLLNLVPVSPAVYPANPRWEPRHRLVGYWFAHEPRDWQPPTDLCAFLDSGEPPLLISLGAMSLGESDALESAALFVNAIQQAGVRAIIQGWESGIQKLSLPENIYSCGSIPHSWLMPRCTAVVHHGGYGTTAACLRAGRPAQVIPHIADQFYWGQLVHQLGVGPPPIPRQKIDPEKLASALNTLISNPLFKSAALTLGQKIQAEQGIAHAVSLIERTFG
jgi:UDP:flavonoid glycosyltransferase YjiC (YdhE family)